MDGVVSHLHVEVVGQELGDFTVGSASLAHLADKLKVRLQPGRRAFRRQAVEQFLKLCIHCGLS